MTRTRFLTVGSVVALLAWVGAALATLLVAAAGVSGAAGWTDYRVPGTSPTFTWSVQSMADIVRADPEDVLAGKEPDQAAGETAFTFYRATQGEDGVVREEPTRVQPESVNLEGTVSMTHEAGWDSLLVAICVMATMTGAVVTLILFQLWRLLRDAASGEPFSDRAVRSIRVIGWVIVAWELVQPAYWLFFSPKALEIGAQSRGPLLLGLGPQEPGGPDLTPIAFGVLLLLLAEVFRHGAELAEERKLTV